MDSTNLSSFKEFLKDLRQTYKSDLNGRLIGCAVETNELLISDSIINAAFKDFEKSFYWKNPESNVEFLALAERISASETGRGKFNSTEKKIFQWKDGFICNFDSLGIPESPVFVGGVKFSSENDADLWNEFDDSCWFVPKMLLYKKGDKSYYIYYFTLNKEASEEEIIKRYKHTYEQLKLRFSEIKYNYPEPKIVPSPSAPKEKKKWIEAAKKGIELIYDHKIEKIVLSRKAEYSLSGEVNFNSAFEKLSRRYPGCVVFGLHIGKSSFFGASPEKLLCVKEQKIETEALAGSIQRGTDEHDDKQLEKELLESSKNLAEHKEVVDFFIKSLEPLCLELNYPSKPGIKKLTNIQHLYTPINGKLNSDVKLFQLASSLYPSPAICGSPQETAYGFIKKLEDYPRGLYAGIIGWLNFSGYSGFYIGLRSALVKGKKLYAFAGSGLIENSDPAAEHKELELKLAPIISLFGNNESK